MKRVFVFSSIFAIVALSGCDPHPLQEGACQVNSDCTSGVCEGGCDGYGTCVPEDRNMCSRDWVWMCSCDGEWFQGSSTCPTRRVDDSQTFCGPLVRL